jgi:hypothetical protein
MGGKRPANEYAFAPMYRRRRIKKRRVVSSLYGIYPPYANTKIDKWEVLRRSLLRYIGVAPYTRPYSAAVLRTTATDFIIGYYGTGTVPLGELAPWDRSYFCVISILQSRLIMNTIL